ncbi:hypothetical protein [Desulfogranum marinum]|uniref:hypothetical protein n=1 Tax=Desulfogranum marinum TaxID=453220 RepID=UPI0029C79248|nr:hypothetical protein [Desulfogranum marinum]
MQFKMIVSRAMFVFNGIVEGKAQLESVRFLSDKMLQEQNNVLIVKEKESVDFFLAGSLPLSKISKEQFACLVAAARFFGHIPGSNGKIPMWFGADSLAMDYHHFSSPQQAAYAYE